MMEFTPRDHREMRSMGVSLEDSSESETAVERLYNTLTVAYQRLDAECALAHHAERAARLERDELRGRMVPWVSAAVVLGFLAGLYWGRAVWGA